MFGLLVHFWYGTPKTLRSSCGESHKGVFSYVNEVGNLMRGCCQGNQLSEWRAETFSPIPQEGKGAEG